jgi:TonB family protein
VPVAAVPVIPPQPISGRAGNRKPDYPAATRQRGLQGKVVLRVGVSTQGLPASAVVATSSGHSALDQAAPAAMQRWHFNPATRRRNARGRHRRSAVRVLPGRLTEPRVMLEYRFLNL